MISSKKRFSNRLLVICGPTSTGKTSLALKVAKKYNGQLVSADSRQVYKNLNIGTGKDLPKNAKLKLKNLLPNYYEVEGVIIWGYDLVDSNKEFSVGHYIKFATKVVKNIWKDGGLPILVGGTGLYIRGIIDGIGTADIPQNKALRKVYADKNADELFDVLAQLDSSKAASLNSSDKKNPRRLIRAIEVASFHKHKKPSKLPIDDMLMIGLRTTQDELAKRVGKRVDVRMRHGFLYEVENLIVRKVKWSSQSMQAFGYKQARDLLDGKINTKTFVEKWKASERNYSKRQLLWFSKDARINWFDVSKRDYPQNVFVQIREWINKGS